jgi:hypothetical protein
LIAFRACGFAFNAGTLNSSGEFCWTSIRTDASVTNITFLALKTKISASAAHIALKLCASCCSHASRGSVKTIISGTLGALKLLIKLRNIVNASAIDQGLIRKARRTLIKGGAVFAPVWAFIAEVFE